MSPESLPTTLGALRESGHEILPIREEMRKNLIARLRTDEPMFADVMGYEENRYPTDRECCPFRPGHHLPRRTGPGKDPNGAESCELAR